MQKGQKAPVGASNKSNQTKLAKYLNSLNLQPWEKYADSKFEHTNSKSATKTVMTLREFHSVLMSGKSVLSCIENGQDKHLMYFYSNLLRGKITLSREKFEDDYLSGISLEEISKKHKISRENTTFLRELYGIKRKGATYIYRKQTEESLTDLQKQLVYGTLMGDGKKMSGSSLGMGQSCNQEEFLLWKYSVLKNVMSENSLKKTSSYDIRYDKTNCSIRCYTYANSDIEQILNQFYRNGTKKITKEILNNLTPFSVAVWYMDDGKVDWHFRTRKHGINSNPTITLCTESFTLEEHELITNWFLEKFQILPEIIECSKGTLCRLQFNTEESEKFLNLVREYIIPSMTYKVNYESYLEKRKEKGLEYEYFKDFNLRNCPLDSNFIKLNDEEKDKWVNAVFSKIRQKHIGYNRLNPEKEQQFLTKLNQTDTSSLCVDFSVLFKGHPSYFVKHFHSHLYDMRNKGSLSATEIFNNDSMLKDVIRSVIMKGEIPTRSAIRRKLCNYRGNRSLSVFPTFGAKTIIDRFSIKDGIVVDFCAGFGNRMLGAWASKNCSTYLACEPFFKTFSGLQRMIQYISNFDSISKNISIQNNVAENFLKQINSEYADLIITSPPYFDTEFYSDDQTQSRVRYDDYGVWLEEWLYRCIDESIRILKKNGYLALNIANCFPYMMADDVEKHFKSNGLTYQKYKLFLSVQKSEPLFIVHKSS